MDFRLPRRSRISIVAPALTTLFWLSPALAAQTPLSQGQTLSVRSIAIAAIGNDAVVTIEADGPLPTPTVGAIDGPPRIFLDFAGVRTKAPAATPSSDPRIRRVRVALHSLQPLVTRVVVDLAALQPHRIQQGPNQVKVFIGGASAPAPVAPPPVAPPRVAAPPVSSQRSASARAAPAPVATTSAPAATRSAADSIPPVPPLPDPPLPAVAPAPGTSAPAVAPSAPPPAAPAPSTVPVTSYKPLPIPPSLREIEKYRTQVLGTLERYRLQLPVLQMIEDREPRTTQQMELALLEIDRLRQELTAIKPPDTLRVQHDLLLQSARLAAMAIRLRGEALQSGDSTVMRNATSASAGAVMMFERACADVGCLNDRRP
jgi:hypothetical protein